MADIAPDVADNMMGPNADPAGRALFIESLRGRRRSATYRAAVNCLVTFDERANLPNIKVPVLCLAAEHDRNAPAPVVEKMAGKDPRRLLLLPVRSRPHAEPGGTAGL